jgi:hypothetical protein
LQFDCFCKKDFLFIFVLWWLPTQGEGEVKLFSQKKGNFVRDHSMTIFMYSLDSIQFLVSEKYNNQTCIKRSSLLFRSNTVKPTHVVTCIKGSPLSCPVIEDFISIQPLLRGYLFEKTTFILSQRWPLNTGLIVILLRY